jgi:ABC-type transporter Mla MlaB component
MVPNCGWKKYFGAFFRVKRPPAGERANRRGTSNANGTLDNASKVTSTRVMLRISVIKPAENAATLHLEGQIAGPWTAELGEACERLLTERCRLTLDLGDVTLIDRPALALLADLSHRSVALVHCSPFQREQLRQAAAFRHENTTNMP